jgi:hypothetical protein
MPAHATVPGQVHQHAPAHASAALHPPSLAQATAPAPVAATKPPTLIPAVPKPAEHEHDAHKHAPHKPVAPIPIAHKAVAPAHPAHGTTPPVHTGLQSAAPKPAPTLPAALLPAAPKPVAPRPPVPAHKEAHAAAKPKLAPLAPPKTPSHGAGQPLAPHIKAAIQNSLMVDLSSVRLHASTAAERKAQSLSARAFTFGNDIFLGHGEHPTDLTLISHEAAHVIQQQHTAPMVQAWSSDRSDRYEREADQAAAAVASGQSFAVRERVDSPRVQRFGISDALDWLADKAYIIPGFRMFTIVLGVNPVNMQHVDRSAANVLRAIVEFLPGGTLITDALEKYGVFDKVGNWISGKIDELGMVGSSIKKALMDFLDSLSWTDIFHLGDVWDRAKRIFTDPIDRIIAFVKGTVEDIWKFVREAILKPISKLAEGTSGWPLLIAVMGKNPITGEPVPQTPDALIGGFMHLIHEDEIWENIKKANAVARAFAWFKSVLSGLLGFVSQIPDLFIKALKSLQWSDILDLPGGFMKIVGVFGKFLVNFISWAGGKVWDLLTLIFEVVAPAVMPYLRKVGAAFKNILKHPLVFVGHLIDAAKLGLNNFIKGFGDHLKKALIDWLTGSLPGVYIPKAFTLPEFGMFALSVLGISWAQIRAKIVKALGPNGEKIMAGLEGVFDVVMALLHGGPAAAWELIKEKLTNLKDVLIDGIVGFVKDSVIKVAVPKLIALFVPGAGFISAIVSIYGAIMVFVQKLAKIVAAVKAFVDSIVAIASGKIDDAAAKVESGLEALLSLTISFLAGFFGLGNVASKVLEVIRKVQAVVDKALDTAITWIITKAKALFAKLFGKKEDKKDENDPEKQKKIDAGITTLHEKESAAPSVKKDQKITHEDAQAVAAQTKSAHPVFTSISVVDGGDKWDYVYTASAGKKIPGLSKEESVELGKAKAEFGKGYFSRDDLEGVLGLGKTATLDRLSTWKGVNQVFTYASAPSDLGTQYTFDKDAAGFRPTNPNNREKFGYHNPAKTSGTGLAILSKKFNPKTPKPVKESSAEYHTSLARYDSARPGSGYENFKFPVAILGHKEKMGASDHWNKFGHKQTKEDNKAWNNDPDHYQGPEHEEESAASGGSSARYEAPTKARGSDPSWWK